MSNGMKSGSGEDPFADAESETDDPDEDEATDDETTETGVGEEGEEPGREERSGSSGSAGVSTTSGPSEPGADTTDGQTTSSDASQDSSLPWKYSRENVKDGRDMVQFYLQPETKAMESRAVAELESELDESVLTFDLREAAYRVALQQHLDDVADKLREWGYDVE